MSNERSRGILATLLLCAVGLAVYGFALQAPLLLDDVLHLKWLEQSDLLTVLTSPGFLSYYRPLPNGLWKVLRLLQGSYHAPTLHALNLALHLANAVLLLWLARLWRGPGGLSYAIAAATLFLLFPFSYQAVPWASAVTHPMAAAFILGALLTLLIGRSRRRPGWMIVSVALALLAPFAHETGVIVAPLAVLLLATAAPPDPLSRALRRSIPYWLCLAIGLAVLLSMRRDASAPQVLNVESRLQNGVYFLQALAYPVSPLSRPVALAAIGLNDLAAVVAVSLPVMAALAVLFARAGRGRQAAFALGWFLLAAAPPWLMLGFEYVIDGPRLLYTASVGAALWWAILVDLPWRSARGRRWGGALAAVATLGIVLFSLAFVRARAGLYEQATLATRQLVEAAGEQPPGRALVAINFPAWLAPDQPAYAVGHEGVPMVASYFSVGDYYWANSGRAQAIDAYVLPDVQKPWRYHYQSWGEILSSDALQSLLRGPAGILVTSYERADVLVHDAGALEAENTSPAADYLASYDGGLALLSKDIARRDGQLRVTLRWQSWAPPAQETTTFLHLHDPAGDLVAQTDGWPVGNVARLSAWKPGDVWRDTRVVPLPAGLKPGRYVLRVGAYPMAGGPRLPAFTPAGARVDNDSAPIGEVELP